MNRQLLFKITALFLFWSSTAAADTAGVRKAGLGLNFGGGYGMGFNGFYSLSEKIEIRPGFGFGISIGRLGTSFADTVPAFGQDVVYSLQGRYYFHPRLYAGTGITYIDRLVISGVVHDTSPVSGKEEEYTAEKSTSALELPLKFGATTRRHLLFSAYIEMGYNLLLNKRGEILVFPVVTPNDIYYAKYKFGGGHFSIGFGGTLNVF